MTARGTVAAIILILISGSAFAADIGVDKSTVNAALLLSGLAFLIPTVNGIVSIWDKTRRKPPLDQELQY